MATFISAASDPGSWSSPFLRLVEQFVALWAGWDELGACSHCLNECREAILKWDKMFETTPVLHGARSFREWEGGNRRHRHLSMRRAARWPESRK
jgi:hypothetical protein